MQLIHWFAKEKDRELHERTHEFHDINKANLKEFGIEGMDTKFALDVDSGQFSINENNVLFLLDDALIGKSHDIIYFKEGVTISDLLSGSSTPNRRITGYFFGFKDKNESFSYIETLFWVDMQNQELKVRLRLTPKEKLKHNLSIVINGKIYNKELIFNELGRRKEFVFEV